MTRRSDEIPADSGMEKDGIPASPLPECAWLDAPLPLLDQIIQRSPIGVAVIDHDGLFRNVNPAYCLIYGYRQEELVGQCFTMVFSASQRDSALLLHRDYLDRGGDLDGEWEVVRRDGTLLNIIARSVRVPGEDDRMRRLVYVVDITEHRRTEIALQATQRLAQLVLDGLTAHICVIDEAGTIVAVNRAWRDFAAANGGSPGEVEVGANYLAVCEAAAGIQAAEGVEAAQFETLLRDVMAGRRQHAEFQYACHSPDEKRWFIVRVSRMAGSDPPRCVIAHDNVTALEQAKEALRHRATTDELTGITNRHTFMDALGVEFERLRRHPALMCSVLALDLDELKRINDTWGHAAGDAALRHVAQVVSAHKRAGDVFGRTGGDEFTLLLPDTGVAEAEALSERLRFQIAQDPVQFAEFLIAVTVSIGITALAAEDTRAAAALARADRALYEAKDSGRNAVRSRTHFE